MYVAFSVVNLQGHNGCVNCLEWDPTGSYAFLIFLILLILLMLILKLSPILKSHLFAFDTTFYRSPSVTVKIQMGGCCGLKHMLVDGMARRFHRGLGRAGPGPLAPSVLARPCLALPSPTWHSSHPVP